MKKFNIEGRSIYAKDKKQAKLFYDSDIKRKEGRVHSREAIVKNLKGKGMKTKNG